MIMHCRERGVGGGGVGGGGVNPKGGWCLLLTNCLTRDLLEEVVVVGITDCFEVENQMEENEGDEKEERIMNSDLKTAVDGITKDYNVVFKYAVLKEILDHEGWEDWKAWADGEFRNERRDDGVQGYYHLYHMGVPYYAYVALRDEN